MLASLSDVQAFLPQDKLDVDDPDIEPLQEDARRVVKGYLSGVIPAVTLATWTDPDSTPDEVRAIAGRLVAAKYYKLSYSEDSLEVPQYAQDLYDEAIAMLQGIVAGTIVLPEIDVVTPGHLTTDDFWPNNKTVGPFFTMDQVF